MIYEELDDLTRSYMLAELKKELIAGDFYVSKSLSQLGCKVFADYLSLAISVGDHQSLKDSINKSEYWNATENYVTNGIARQRKVNIDQASTRLAVSEFSTFYVLGLAKRLESEDETECEIYRGAQPKWEPGECADHEGQIVPLKTIIIGHRKRYWPEPGDKTAFAIPFGPGCHHLIRRIPK